MPVQETIKWHKFTGLETQWHVKTEYTDPVSQGLSWHDNNGTLYPLVPCDMRDAICEKMGWSVHELKSFLRAISLEKLGEKKLNVVFEFEDKRRG